MIVYHSTKQGFVQDVFNGTIADDIENAYQFHLGRKPSPNEKLSWKNSMMYMYTVINTPDIPDISTVAIEYQIPLTAKRIDFIISGTDNNKTNNVVIVELKQWETASLTDKHALVSTRFLHGEHETTHPSYQAWSYAYMLENYNENITNHNIKLYPCAFLHNYPPDGVIDAQCYSEFIERAPIFLKNDAQALQNFIKKHVKHGSKQDIVWLIENGKLRPSKQLTDSLASMLKGNREFVMLDDQKVVYEQALSLAKQMKKGKQVLIIEGGPGTGKSVIAINLLVELQKLGLVSQYVSKNAAPRDVYTAKLTGSFKAGFIKNLFVGSGGFIDTPNELFDVLLVDEAHRLNLKSGLFNNKGNNQIEEIIQASKLSIFFIDDHQRIHIKDIGSKSYIELLANKLGASVHCAKLSSQFRCNGSDGYLSWLDNTLQIKETANIKLTSEDYDFRIFDNPNELFDTIKEKNKISNKARVVAGYCWDWNSKRNPSGYDIIIPQYDFKKRWNLGKDGNLWIIGEESIEEIGCIHTCQGLELDYIGVIVGPDIVYKNGQIVTDVSKRASTDRSVFGYKQMLSKNKAEAISKFDDIIKNTYRTLMTRGIKGCYVYFCDPELAKHFAAQIMEVESKEPSINSIKKDNGIRIEPEVNDNVKYLDFLPIYSVKAACGYFGDGELVEPLGWVRADGIGKINRNMFVVKAVGNSMLPSINDGDLCVFRANPAGSRQGKTVLIQHYNSYDPEYGGSYSIKVYESIKSYNDDGTWSHEKIILNPKNKAFNPIIINEEDANEYRIIGDFVGVLK